MSQTFKNKIAEYFGTRLGWGQVDVRDARRLMGGISRETWRVAVDISGPQGTGPRELILRLDPPSSLLESNRRVEYAMFRAFDGVPGVPVPQALCSEDDPSHLGASFMATAALPGVADISMRTWRPSAPLHGWSLAKSGWTSCCRRPPPKTQRRKP